MLETELKFWGIDRRFFNPVIKSKFELIQDELYRPLTDFILHTNERDVMLHRFETNKLNFKELCEQK